MVEFITFDDTRIALEDETIDAFRAQVRGDILQRGVPGYDEARRIFNGMIDRHPALIVLCSGAADVKAAVDFVRTHQVLCSVHGGGHGVAGSAVCDDGLMINLERMNSVHVDPARRIGWVDGGCKLRDMDHETAAHGLVCPGGVVSTTGVAGLTLGGGYGWLRAKFGMTIDNLRAVDMVTADGKFVHASEEENPDLFWGIRGGGGNFGIVTSFEFQLHPIESQIMLCSPVYAAEHATTVLKGWRDFMEQAPDELTSEFFFWTIPVDDKFPAELHGKDVVIPGAVYYGSAVEGAKVVQPLRELAPVLIDLSGPNRFVDIQQNFDSYLPYGEIYGYWKPQWLDSLTDDICETLIQHFLDRPEAGRLCPFVLHMINGASPRIANDATAFTGRSWPYMMEYNMTWGSPQASEECTAWVRKAWSELRDRHAQRGGGYLNIESYSRSHDLSRVKETFGDNFARLQKLKQRYDPMNLFRFNYNIPPIE